MSKRDYKFPDDDREASLQRRSRGLGAVLRHPLLLMLVIAAGVYIYEMPERPWEPYVERLQVLWGELVGERNREATAEQTMQGPVASPLQKDTQQREFTSSLETIEPASVLEAIRLDLSIGIGFRPVGFKIGAVPKAIKLSEKPPPQIRRLPKFTSPYQRYGKIILANGLEFNFALDLVSIDYQMYLDRNRNGDLSDDGPPLNNDGRIKFAGGLNFPLKVVSGVPELDGEYKIWIYTKQDSWQRWEMLYFSMTQLRGELVLSGKRYTAFLADNGPVDGDYRNDGVNIDLDGDGKIERETEFFPDGSLARIDGVNYLFRVTH